MIQIGDERFDIVDTTSSQGSSTHYSDSDITIENSTNANITKSTDADVTRISLPSTNSFAFNHKRSTISDYNPIYACTC